MLETHAESKEKLFLNYLSAIGTSLTGKSRMYTVKTRRTAEVAPTQACGYEAYRPWYMAPLFPL
jgi:hypothetical protein